MLQLHLTKVYERGLASFSSMTALERDVFAVHDANLRIEMEGRLSALVGSGSGAIVATWLSETLRRIGDESSLQLLYAIATVYDAEPEPGNLSAKYLALQSQRWTLLDQYLESHGAQVIR